MGDLLNVDASVLADERVQEALGRVERGIDKEAAQVLTATPANRLSSHGLTLRVSGLQHKALISRIMYACPVSPKPKRNESGQVVTDAGGKPILEMTHDIPSIIQTLWWLYSLAAPLTAVYGAITLLERDGLDAFSDRVDAWFSERGLSGEALQDIIAAMTEEMQLTQTLAPPAPEGKAGDVKNV